MNSRKHGWRRQTFSKKQDPQLDRAWSLCTKALGPGPLSLLPSPCRQVEPPGGPFPVVMTMLGGQDVRRFGCCVTLRKGGGFTPHTEQRERTGRCEWDLCGQECEGLENVQAAVCPELVENQGRGGIKE